MPSVALKFIIAAGCAIAVSAVTMLTSYQIARKMSESDSTDEDACNDEDEKEQSKSKSS